MIISGLIRPVQGKRIILTVAGYSSRVVPAIYAYAAEIRERIYADLLFHALDVRKVDIQVLGVFEDELPDL